MAQKPTYKPGDVVGRWRLAENLGVGGNGEAWRAQAEDGVVRVIKVLRPGEERFARFKREVMAVNALVPTGFPALPVEEMHLPEKPSKADPAFCVMPEAVPIERALADKDIPTRVNAVRQLADALATLVEQHHRNHRDVKPANLYEYEGRYVLGDFGLITDPDPDAAALTEEGKILGPWAFLPSEVFNPLPDMEIDWEKVDVYCLAMSLWCLVVGSRHPPRRIEPRGVTSLARQLAVPPRPADPHSVEDQRITEYRQHVGELDTILAAATADDPAARPTLARFALQLADWGEGVRFRDDFRAYVAQSEEGEAVVLAWLVAAARTDASLGLNIFDVSDDAATSPVPGLNAGRFSNALEGLVASYHAAGERFPERGPVRHWTNVHPTAHGIEHVEYDRVTADTLPLLRTLARSPIEQVSFAGTDEAVDFGDIALPGAELYFLLRYLKESSLVDYDEHLTFGPNVSIMYSTLTRLGRVRLARESPAR